MNSILSQIFLSNTVKAYLIISIIIFSAFVMRKFFSNYIANFLFTLCNRFWKTLDKKIFISLLINPLNFSFFLFITVISLHRLHFPEKLNTEIYNFTLKDVLNNFGIAILIIAFTWLILRLIDFGAYVLMQKALKTPTQTDDQLINFLRDFIKIIIGIVGILLLLNFAFNLNVSHVLTGLSIVGAALALALRESLENLIASFVIFFDKPFVTGDLVSVKGITGTVEKIGLRSTRLRTDEKTYVTIPNKQMADSILDNQSLRTQRKATIKLELNTNNTYEKLTIFLTQIRELLFLENVTNINVMMDGFARNALLVNIEYFTEPVNLIDYNKQLEKINLEILQLTEKNGISLALSNPIDRGIQTPK